MGATHFLTKGMERVKAEMSLHVLAYNFRRLMAILGTEKMLAAIRAHAHFLTLQGLIEAVSMLVPMNILKRDYVLWNASQRSEISFGPYNSSQGLDFEFLHSLGRKRSIQ